MVTIENERSTNANFLLGRSRGIRSSNLIQWKGLEDSDRRICISLALELWKDGTHPARLSFRNLQISAFMSDTGKKSRITVTSAVVKNP